MSETDLVTQGSADVQSTDHATADGVMSEGSNIRERLLMPIMIPALVVVIVAFVAINLSRIFLATGGAVAVGIAIALMVGIMVMAVWLSANEGLRSSTASIMAVAALFLLLSAGLTTLGAAEDHGEDEGGVEALPVDSAITVDAGNFFLIPKPEISPPGVLEFTYVNTEAGRHTLLIEEDPAFGPLGIDGIDDTDVGKAELEAGSYILFCDIPGHRQQGMETTITIEEGAPTVGGDESEGTGATPGGTPEDQPVEG